MRTEKKRQWWEMCRTVRGDMGLTSLKRYMSGFSSEVGCRKHRAAKAEKRIGTADLRTYSCAEGGTRGGGSSDRDFILVPLHACWVWGVSGTRGMMADTKM